MCKIRDLKCLRCDALARGDSRSSPAWALISAYPFPVLEQVDFRHIYDIGLLAGYAVRAAVEAHQLLRAGCNGSIPFRLESNAPFAVPLSVRP